MSKNKPPKNPIPTPHPPEGPPRPPEDPMRIVVDLVHIDVVVLQQCQDDDEVTVQYEQNPITVTLPSGIRLGEVREQDAAIVRNRRRLIGHIVVCDVENVRCSIEV